MIRPIAENVVEVVDFAGESDSKGLVQLWWQQSDAFPPAASTLLAEYLVTGPFHRKFADGNSTLGQLASS